MVTGYLEIPYFEREHLNAGYFCNDCIYYIKEGKECAIVKNDGPDVNGEESGIIHKKSSARLWKGHTAEGELGLAYEDVDLILNYFEKGIPIPRQLKKKAIKIKGLIEKNKHKQEMPVVCKITT